MVKRVKGKIKWWDKDRAFGFVEVMGYEKDVFIHIKNFQDKYIKSNEIEKDEEIECEVVREEKGLSGIKILYLGMDNRINEEITTELENQDKFIKCKRSSEKDESRCKFYIPKDTNNVFDSDLKQCENINLLFYKYPIFDKGEKADIKSNYYYIKDKKWEYNYGQIKNIYIKRIHKLLDDIQDGNYSIEKRKYKLDWRLAVGLGETSVYETCIKLHHIYGHPYIPASTFKGTIRSWVINNYFGGDEYEALNDDFVAYVFGRQKKNNVEEQKGNIIFFDTNPVCFPSIELDIINTHYSEYYQGGMVSPPGDYYNPSLVNFLTVANTTFEFIYGYDYGFNIGCLKNTRFERSISEEINNWIEEALNYQGIGAKTSVGYGYFTNKA